jgi:hypothetical protein
MKTSLRKQLNAKEYLRDQEFLRKKEEGKAMRKREEAESDLRREMT